MWSVPLGMSLWERWPCVQWTHSHHLERDARVYSGHVHTAVEETTVIQLALQRGTLHVPGAQSFLFERMS